MCEFQPEEQDVKLEVSETESVAIVHEVSPFICVIHEPETVETETLAVEETPEPQLQTPVIESVNSISTDFSIQNETPREPGSPGRKRKVMRKRSST